VYSTWLPLLIHLLGYRWLYSHIEHRVSAWCLPIMSPVRGFHWRCASEVTRAESPLIIWKFSAALHSEGKAFSNLGRRTTILTFSVCFFRLSKCTIRQHAKLYNPTARQVVQSDSTSRCTIRQHVKLYNPTARQVVQSDSTPSCTIRQHAKLYNPTARQAVQSDSTPSCTIRQHAKLYNPTTRQVVQSDSTPSCTIRQHAKLYNPTTRQVVQSDSTSSCTIRPFRFLSLPLHYSVSIL